MLPGNLSCVPINVLLLSNFSMSFICLSYPIFYLAQKIKFVKNLSSKHLPNEGQGLLKFDLHQSLPPSRINKTYVFVSFEMMHCFLLENLKSKIDKPALKSELLHFANSYVYNYKPSRPTLRKRGILRKLKNNKSIIILRRDKGNGIVVLDRIQSDNVINEIISDKTKIKELPEDETIK